MKPSYLTTWRTAWLLALTAALSLGISARSVGGQGPQQATDGVEALEVRPNFYMIAGAGGNIGVHVGPAGAVLIDTGSAHMSDAVLAAIKGLTKLPIRYIINTSADADHVGGNEKLSKAGVSIMPPARGLGGTGSNFGFAEGAVNNQGAASIFAHDNVLGRMMALSNLFSPAWPTKTFTGNTYSMYLNGDGIEVIHQPAAHSNGDSIVFFRRADVIVTGDIFDATRFPVIALERGGSIQGEIDALNRLMQLAIGPFPMPWQSDRTYLIPGHGRIADEADLTEYRDDLTIIRDVIQSLITKGMTLEQVKAADPTKGYRAIYGADSGSWTTDMFVEAVYKSLTGRKQN